MHVDPALIWLLVAAAIGLGAMIGALIAALYFAGRVRL